MPYLIAKLVCQHRLPTRPASVVVIPQRTAPYRRALTEVRPLRPNVKAWTRVFDEIGDGPVARRRRRADLDRRKARRDVGRRDGLGMSLSDLLIEVRRVAKEGTATDRAALLAAMAAGVIESADGPGSGAKAPGGPQDELTPEDVAATLKLSRCTVYGLLRTGRLPFRREGRLWRVAPSDLANYQASARRGVGTTGSQARGPRRLAA
jgi:excisionase family DNA binding protein